MARKLSGSGVKVNAVCPGKTVVQLMPNRVQVVRWKIAPILMQLGRFEVNKVKKAQLITTIKTYGVYNISLETHLLLRSSN